MKRLLVFKAYGSALRDQFVLDMFKLTTHDTRTSTKVNYQSGPARSSAAKKGLKHNPDKHRFVAVYLMASWAFRRASPVRY